MSDCSCIYTECDWYSEEYYETEVTAKKAIRCIECYRVIPRGEKHIKADYTNEDNEWRVRRICVDCKSVIESFFCGSYKYDIVWEALEQHLNDHEGKVPADCLVELTPKAREKVCEMIEEIWSEMAE